MKHQRLAKGYEETISAIKSEHVKYMEEVELSAKKKKKGNTEIHLKSESESPKKQPEKPSAKKKKRNGTSRSIAKTQRQYHTS